MNYDAYGMPGEDDWYVLSYPHPDYALIYYCGSSTMDAYRGGVVIGRSANTDIPIDILEEFEEALANAGLSTAPTLDDFCIPDNSGCISE